MAVGLITLGLLILLPRLSAAARRRARPWHACFCTSRGCRSACAVAEHLPPGQCVVVCNHASYLDGVVLTAALPPQFGFVIKREMADGARSPVRC